MPLEFSRFAPTGPRDPRETAQKCNNLGEATARQIAAIEAILLDLKPAAYGGMEIDSPPVVAVDIPAVTYLPITFYQSLHLPSRGCTFDPVGGTVSIDSEVPGVWQFILNFTIEHNESNSGRTVNVRLFNVTDGLPVGSSWPIGIGRNQPTTNFAHTFMAEVFPALTGKLFRFEIGGGPVGDTLTGVIWNGLSFDATYQDRLAILADLPF